MWRLSSEYSLHQHLQEVKGGNLYRLAFMVKWVEFRTIAKPGVCPCSYSIKTELAWSTIQPNSLMAFMSVALNSSLGQWRRRGLPQQPSHGIDNPDCTAAV